MVVREERGMVRVMEMGETGDVIMMANVEVEGEVWRVIGVYINGDMERKIEEMKKWMEERMEEKEENKWTIIRGDFNARTGRLGGVIRGEEEEEKRSKDKKINEEGKKLIGDLEEVGWGIFNGGIRGNEKGEFTYTRGMRGVGD